MRYLLITLSVLAFAGCSGGGSDGQPTVVEQPTPENPSSTELGTYSGTYGFIYNGRSGTGRLPWQPETGSLQQLTISPANLMEVPVSYQLQILDLQFTAVSEGSWSANGSFGTTSNTFEVSVSLVKIGNGQFEMVITEKFRDLRDLRNDFDQVTNYSTFNSLPVGNG